MKTKILLWSVVSILIIGAAAGAFLVAAAAAGHHLQRRQQGDVAGGGIRQTPRAANREAATKPAAGAPRGERGGPVRSPRPPTRSCSGCGSNTTRPSNITISSITLMTRRARRACRFRPRIGGNNGGRAMKLSPSSSTRFRGGRANLLCASRNRATADRR